MKIPKVPGEFYFKALVKSNEKLGWLLTGIYFKSLDELKLLYPTHEVLWPVEVYEDGSIYIPSKEELNEEDTNTAAN